jgi:hypothetical protein
LSGASGNLKNYEDHIIRHRGICRGEPVFKGTRVTLRTVLASLAAEIPPKRFLPISLACFLVVETRRFGKRPRGNRDF